MLRLDYTRPLSIWAKAILRAILGFFLLTSQAEALAPGRPVIEARTRFFVREFVERIFFLVGTGQPFSLLAKNRCPDMIVSNTDDFISKIVDLSGNKKVHYNKYCSPIYQSHGKGKDDYYIHPPAMVDCSMVPDTIRRRLTSGDLDNLRVALSTYRAYGLDPKSRYKLSSGDELSFYSRFYEVFDHPNLNYDPDMQLSRMASKVKYRGTVQDNEWCKHRFVY